MTLSPKAIELSPKAIETATGFGAGTCRFCANAEFERLTGMYGPMDRLQTSGNPIDG